MLKLLVIFIFIIVGGIAAFYSISSKNTVVVNKNYSKDFLAKKIETIFKLRNQSLLAQNEAKLKKLYDRENKTGRWAYQHELKKMKYLEQWSAKQGVEFKKINSEIHLRTIKEKKNYLIVNLLVSTRYQYNYLNLVDKDNNFRIGTYHSLKLKPTRDQLIIIREWYRDPFSDSLHLDKIKNNKVKKIIANHNRKLNNLNSKRIKVVEYADQYCGAASPPKYGFKYNSEYKNYNYQGGDCANFASQMLYEYGGFSKNRTWNYRNRKGSKAWLNAHTFNQYMIHSGRASKITYGSYLKVLKKSYKLLPGDYIAYEKKGQVKHISVVTGIDSRGYTLVNCHNSDRYRVPWDLGWSNNEIKFWLVRINYN